MKVLAGGQLASPWVLAHSPAPQEHLLSVTLPTHCVNLSDSDEYLLVRHSIHLMYTLRQLKSSIRADQMLSSRQQGGPGEGGLLQMWRDGEEWETPDLALAELAWF